MEKELPIRKNIRLQEYDYSQMGYYFVTFCTKDKEELFGRIVGTTALGRPFVELMPLGKCVEETIQIANNENVKIDKYIVMPNHVHMIVILQQGTDDRGRSSLQQVVRNVKSFVTKFVRIGYFGRHVWRPYGGSAVFVGLRYMVTERCKIFVGSPYMATD